MEDRRKNKTDKKKKPACCR